MDSLPTELLTSIALILPDPRSFAIWLLICRRFHTCVSKTEYAYKKLEYCSRITLGRVIKYHNEIDTYETEIDLPHYLAAEVYVGSAFDIMCKTCKTFSFRPGTWTIMDHSDRWTSTYGYHVDTPRDVILKFDYVTHSDDDYYGIASRVSFDEEFEDMYTEDTLTDPGMYDGYDDWLMEMAKRKTDWIGDLMYSNFNVNSGWSTYDIYVASSQNDVVAFWIIPNGDNPVDILNRK